MAEIRLFLLGTAWAALCYQRGIFLLHAGSIKVGDAAVAFCGNSGAGKSSLVASCSAQGYSPLSDDLCRFDIPGHGLPRIYPSISRLKLWNDTLQALGLSSTGLKRDHFRLEKFHLPLFENSKPHCISLKALYLLQWGEGEPSLSRLRGTNAVRGLVHSATYRGNLLESMGRLADHWAFCRDLARRVQIWNLSRPFDWDAQKMTMNMLRGHFQQLSNSRKRDEKA